MTDDEELARTFLAALAEAAKTGDFDSVYPLLAPDVHWLTPLRNLHGIGEVRKELAWFSPRENVAVEFDQQLTDLGGGRFVSDVHETYRSQRSGEVAFASDRRIELTIRGGKIARYEMHVGG
jgi:hypothetical protein